MPKTLYSFHFKREIALLTEEEWAIVSDLLTKGFKQVISYRKRKGCSLSEAVKMEPLRQKALDEYERICGERLKGYEGSEHPDLLYKARLSQYGSPCPECTRPFRTPRAKMCAECGYELPIGQVAGPA